MADVYTDITNGDDGTGTGAWDDPYQTIQKAIDEAAGGDVIWIGDSATNTLGAQLNWTSFGAPDTGVDTRLVVRGWDYSGNEGADGLAVISGGGSIASPLAAAKDYVTWWHLHFDDFTTDGVLSGSSNLFYECKITNIDAGYAVSGGSANGCKVIGCYIDTVAGGPYTGGAGGLIDSCSIIDHTGYGIASGADTNIRNNILVSNGGSGIYLIVDRATVSQNTIVGDGSTASIYGITIAAGAEACVIKGNLIKGWSGTSNIGISNPSSNSIALCGYNHFDDNTADMTNVTDNLDIDLTSSDGSAAVTFTDSGSGDYSIDVTGTGYDAPFYGLATTQTMGTGAVQSAGSGGGASAAEVRTEIDAALVAIKLDKLLYNTSTYATDVTADSILDTVANTSANGGTFNRESRSLDAIANGGASIEDIADGQHNVLIATTITVTDQTHFVLAAGSADDDAYNDMLVVLEDVSTATQKAVGTVDDYTGSTKTVTLSASPAFTIATTDKVRILAVGSTGGSAPTAVAIRQEMDSNSTELAKIGTPVALDSGAATVGGMLAKLADDNDGANYDAETDSQAALSAAVPTSVEVRQEMDSNSTELAKIGTPVSLDSGAATVGGMLAKLADDNDGADYDAETDSQAALYASVDGIADDLYGDSRYPKYAALIEADFSGSNNEYTVKFLQNGEPIESGITSPTISVLQRSDGNALVSGETLTAISAGWYKYTEASNLVTTGDTALIDVSATYAGGTIKGQRSIVKYA